MAETKLTTIDVLSEAVENILARKCPLCGGDLSASWELGCMFVRGAMECKKLSLRDDDPAKEQFEQRARILSTLKLLLGATQ